VIATVLAGGALAAAGQSALSQTLPLASDGANVLKLGVQELLGTPTSSQTVPLVALAPAVGPGVAVPRPVDVGELVKAAELHGRAARTASTPDDRAAAERAAPVDVAPPEPQAVPSRADAPADEVQMVTGRVTSGFGARWGHVHKGLDIAAPVGTPIHVPLAGEVIASGPASGFGLWVRVRHDDGTVTTYGHVNRALVRVGQHVEAG
jgi:murein DD-endopeptidase MepM/ murein hydrolase activator NlpD